MVGQAYTRYHVYCLNFMQKKCLQIKDYEIALIKSYEIEHR
jgi:hypothetical protein